ncbi:MAG: four helix bundle protein [Candidatus Paceibacterota bacterium]|jgi:hypothetical protein
MIIPPPPTSPTSDKTPSVIHKVRLLHKEIYTIGSKLAKRNKLGIHQGIEKMTTEMFSSLIEAAFTPRPAKLRVLEIARIRQSVIQNLVRTEYELEIINENIYMKLSGMLVEVAKEINAWISDTERRTVMQKRPFN